MTVVNNVFPQSGDADFAENFATWVGRGNISDYVETGLNFTVDYAASPPTVDITEGKSFLIIDETTISSNNETRLLLDYAITTEATTSVPLNAGETNNLVYLNPNVGTNDSPSFEVETASGNAGATWMLIGVVDTVNDSFELRNRNPDASFDNLSARESIDIPTYAEFSEADASESSTIYIDGSGGPDQGIYVHNGSSFISSGVREINKLLDVDGIESFTADVASNRPAAGTQGRLFIDETNNRIQLDTGSVWIDIGTNAENIGAGDLGFDPATQNELDTHAGESDIHHTRPSAGNGLKDQTNTFNIEPTEFVGQFLSDNADNIDVQIGRGLEDDGSGQIQFNEDASYTFPNQQIINGILTMGADIDLSNNNLVEPNQLQTSGSGSDIISVQDTFNATSILTLSEGGEVAVTSGDLTNGGTTTIYDQSSSHVPLATLEHDSVTVTSGDGLKSGGTVTLGSSITLNIEPNDFAGDGLVDDGVDNLALAQDSVTINANDGLKSGGTVALGSSVGLDVEPADFAGTFLSDDGADNLQVNIGTGVENDGTGSVRVDEDYDFTFTEAIDFSAGLDTQGDISDGTQIIWDASAQEIPDSALGTIENSTLASVDNSALTNSSITFTAGDGLKNGGAVSLGSSTTVDIEPADFAGSYLSDDGADNLQVNLGTGVESDGADNIRVDEDYDFTFTAAIDFSAGLDTQEDITDGTQVIWDATAQEITDSALGSIANTTLTNSSITVAGNSVSLGGSTTVSTSDISGDTDGLTEGASNLFYTDERAQDGVGGILGANFTYDDSGNAITLTNDAVTVTAGTALVGGGTVSLGSSITIDHEDTSTQGNVAAAAGAAITDANLDGNGHVTSLTTTDFDSRYVTESGDTMSGDLNLGGNALTNTTAIFGEQDLAINTAGSGTDSITLQDTSTATPTRIMRLTEGDQNVEIRNGDLEVGNVSGGDVRISGTLTEGATL